MVTYLREHCERWYRCNVNKSAQSNIGRGPRRGAVAHVRRKVPIGYNGAPQIRPKSTPSRGPIPNPTNCLIPGPVRPTMSNGIRIRSAVFSTMHWTDRRTDRPTDRLWESLIAIGRCAILKIHKQVYLGHLWTDLHQIWFADTYWPYKGYREPKIVFLATAILNLVFRLYLGRQWR